MAECKFSVGSGDCTFKAKPGAVKPLVEGTTGIVLFQKATYNGADIPSLPANTISFTVVAGRTDLAVVLGSGSGARFPISVTYSTRTELIDHPTWRGQVGVSYDFDSLFSG